MAAHQRLNAAVFAAYGWPGDIGDDESLKWLLQLNGERAAVQGAAPEAGEPSADDNASDA